MLVVDAHDVLVSTYSAAGVCERLVFLCCVSVRGSDGECISCRFCLFLWERSRNTVRAGYGWEEVGRNPASPFIGVHTNVFDFNLEFLEWLLDRGILGDVLGCWSSRFYPCRHLVNRTSA